MDVQQNVAAAQEQFVINLGADVAKIVSPFDRKELASAYLQMFSGFAWVNWTNKHSLGRAWQTALTQCGAFADTKNNKNPAAKYLKSVYEAHKKYWSRVIMTHRGRDNTINPNDQDIKKLRAHGEQMIREAMDKINLILGRYNERTEEMIASQAKEQTQMHATAVAPVAKHTAPQTTPAKHPQEHIAAQQPEINAWPHGQQNAQTHNVASAAQPATQSGTFAMVRDAVKRPNTAVADKPVEVPMAKPAQVKPVEQKPVEQKPAEQQPAQMPIEVREQKPQTVVQHAPKSVAQPVKQSGALPAVRNNAKPQNVVKTETKANQFIAAQKRIEISAIQRAHMQMKFQQQIQMWQFGQYKQNAA